MMTFRFVSMLCACISLVSVQAAAVSPSAASSCAERAADIQKRQIGLQKQNVARKAMLEETEAAGDVWEEAEIHRLASAGHAAKADAAKSEYDTLKADLIVLNQTVQSGVEKLNQDVAQYNGDCVTK